MVASMGPQRDHETLIRAVPYVTRQIPGFVLRLVGDGSERARLERVAAELRTGSSIEFLGTRTDIPALLERSHVFVFSTTPQEGLGIALLEGLAAGRPVIATDVPACRELLRDGQFGSLIPPRDPARLAAELVKVISDLSDQGAAERQRSYVRGFSPEQMMGDYLGLVGLKIDGFTSEI
jgi:glycosyltransferase involved in cell wall biosynthesis